MSDFELEDLIFYKQWQIIVIGLGAILIPAAVVTALAWLVLAIWPATFIWVGIVYLALVGWHTYRVVSVFIKIFMLRRWLEHMNVVASGWHSNG